MLKNAAYTGMAKFVGGELQQPQIITEEVFEMVRAKLKRNKELTCRNGKRQYLLSRYIYCNFCGRRYVGSISGDGKSNFASQLYHAAK